MQIYKSYFVKHKCFQPQHSIPDVFIWVISNGKRTAYQRIPARELIYSIVDEESGRHCGKVFAVFLKVRQHVYILTRVYNLDTGSFVKLGNKYSEVFLQFLVRTNFLVSTVLSDLYVRNRLMCSQNAVFCVVRKQLKFPK